MKNLKQFLDNSHSYRLVAVIFYVQYLSYILTFDANNFPLFPNPIFLAIISIDQFILTIISQKRKPRHYGKIDFIVRHLLAIIPPFLGAKTIKEMEREVNFEKNDSFYRISYYILFGVFFIIGILIVILILGIVVFVKDTRIFFLLYSSSLGLTGMSLGDAIGNYYISKNKSLDLDKLNFCIFFKSLLETQIRRITILLLSLFLILILIILNLHAVFPILVV